MLKRTDKYGRVLISTIFISLAVPVLSIASDLGSDWYCSDAAAHSKYTKHLQLHLDHGADAIATALDGIYSDSSLSSEQKHVKTLIILKRELSKVKVGPGVGD